MTGQDLRVHDLPQGGDSGEGGEGGEAGSGVRVCGTSQSGGH